VRRRTASNRVSMRRTIPDQFTRSDCWNFLRWDVTHVFKGGASARVIEHPCRSFFVYTCRVRSVVGRVRSKVSSDSPLSPRKRFSNFTSFPRGERAGVRGKYKLSCRWCMTFNPSQPPHPACGHLLPRSRGRRDLQYAPSKYLFPDRVKFKRIMPNN